MDVTERLRQIQLHWRINIGDRLEGGHRSDVFACWLTTGDSAVLKLVKPGDVMVEVAALNAWRDSSRAAEVLRFDEDLGAIALTRMNPGTPLPSGNDSLVVDVVSKLMMSLYSCSPADAAIPQLSTVFESYIERARLDAEWEKTEGLLLTTAGLDRLSKARVLAMQLCETAIDCRLLHGDLCDKNILLDKTVYKVIDPVACMGDICAEIAFFAVSHPPASTIWERAKLFADSLGMDCERVKAWAAIWIVGEACGSWRDDAPELHALAASEEVDAYLQ